METRRVSFAAQNEIDAEQAFLNSMKALQELDEAGTPITVTITEDAAKVETEQTNGDKDESDSDSGDSSAHEDTQNEEQITPDSGDAGVQSNIAPTTSASTKSRSSSPVKPDVQEVQETTAAPASSPPASASQPRRTTLPFSYEEDSEPTAPSGNVTGAPSSTSDNTNGHRHVSPSPSITSSINVTPSATSHVPEQSAVNSANNTPPPLSMIASTKPTGVISNSSSVISPGVTHKRKRLPQDRVGQLEDRIAEDSRGDVDAWLNLIAEHQKKGKSDEARAVFERFFTVFPACAEQWVAYVKMELANNEFHRVEQIFSRCLIPVPNVELWALYLNYIRRRQNLSTDTGGRARAIVSQAYEFVLNNVGMDKDAGQIWQDYVQFVKSAPGNIGGSGWQDQQKMDHLRKVYQRVICMPVQGVDALWREYDTFEMGLNKITGRKFLQDKSALFMTARSSLIELNNITGGLSRTTTPRLPPLPGFDGYEEYTKQVELWNKWIAWEKEDPLVLAKDDPNALRQRILYTYKQALMALRFHDELWYAAAEYCFSNGLENEGTEFLKQGMTANPESCLLHLKYAERLEAGLPVEDGFDATRRRGQTVRKPYDDLLNNLYSQVAKIQQREKDELARLDEMMPGRSNSPGRRMDDDDDDEDDEDIEAITNRAAKEAQTQYIKDASKAQILGMSKTISAIWIDLMRAMRRIEGHGKVGDNGGGSRQVFADARKKGKITSDVYVASALIEYHCYKDPAATRIFERGMRLFPEDEEFALEYLKHLIAINDITNARAVFETFVGKVPAAKAKKVFQFFYEYEAHYGDLGQIYKLEKRMTELYPNDSHLGRFTQRYSYKSLNPCNYQPIISPMAQLRPKQFNPQAYAKAPSPEPQATPQMTQPVPQSFSSTNTSTRSDTTNNTRIGSPKRVADDTLSDNEPNQRPKKMHRGDSPLKGAAGRRLDQAKRGLRSQQRGGDDRRGGAGDNERDGGRSDYRAGGASGGSSQQAPPQPLIPDAIMFLLGIIPNASKFNAGVRFKPEAIVGLLREVGLPGQQGYGYNR